ncbi:NADPH:quinone reductase-like Zn-dependent oxidoreductase [Kitasatospora sp. SolWspMP-SS2h]|uniref:NADPH:quinone oxidoreductase family protein n=1 Tax=Kitasatospora sp. SolWspMP-SS2h TaxID=1305729 RepID=UPI000DBA0D76|nr:NADPH:quinone oxidoreductase family protein [Kitasatospora sp. SolWspMP-SS2h]RAJ40434.1 NADPH:quinone reductase-like Zn-dependent oxidoreductase [Kitasatospora sp. SolWspMP-SS2h]
MRAWQITELGAPRDVMKLVEDADPPVPGPGQLLVRVRAAAVNFPDALMAAGLYQVRPPLPFTPGVELCGEVAEGPRTGERLIGTAELPAGAFAEQALMNAATALPAPGHLDDAEAAAFHIAYQTAWFALHRRARLAPGETLLVHAAAGGVGSAAVQLGKAAGAFVIAVVGGPEKAAVASELGADLVVDRRAGDFVAAVKDATGGRGADVVFDPVGGPAFTGSTRCVAFEGRIVLVGFASGEIPAPALGHALVKNYSLLGLHWGRYVTEDPAAVRDCHAALTALAPRPLVSARLPLDAAATAVHDVASGTTTGRLAIVP